CNPPAANRWIESSAGNRKRPSPRAERARLRSDETHPRRVWFPNSPSYRARTPDSRGHRASAAPDRWPVAPMRQTQETSETMQVLRSVARLSRGQLRAAVGGEQEGGRHRSRPTVARVLGKSRAFHRDLVADLYRVSLPAASYQRVRRAKLKPDLLDGAGFVFGVDEDVSVWIDPVHFGNDAGKRGGFGPVV